MPKAKTPSRGRTSVKKVNKCTPVTPVHSCENIWARTLLLVEVLIRVMEGEIRSTEEERSPQWLRLFGAKDSAIVNLQKLVQLMAQLREYGNLEAPDSQVAPVSDEEMAMLRGWLEAQGSAEPLPA